MIIKKGTLLSRLKLQKKSNNRIAVFSISHKIISVSTSKVLIFHNIYLLTINGL